MRVDSHHHLWNYSASAYPWIGEQMNVLRRDFTAENLKSEIDSAGIDCTIVVQARQSLAETEWLIGVASEYDFIKGVVGWVPLADAAVERELERLSQFPSLKSVRHVVQDEAEDAFILGTDFNRGISLLKDFGLAYDILIFAKHLSYTIAFVDRHPEQSFVLDHIAKPTILSNRFDQDWEAHFRQLAMRENVTCKFSALVTEVRDPQWSVETLRPYWDVALEAFGPKRLMFGSDWPVCLLRSGYTIWTNAACELTGQLSEPEQKEFWGETAQRIYGL